MTNEIIVPPTIVSVKHATITKMQKILIDAYAEEKTHTNNHCVSETHRFG